MISGKTASRKNRTELSANSRTEQRSMHIARGILSLVGAIAIAWGFSPNAEAGRALDFGPVIGTWEGSLDPVNGPGLVTSDKRLPIRMTVRDDGAQVFTGENFEVEAKPGKFKVERTATNMIVFEIDSGEDNDGVWVETWAFVITQKDRDTLITNFYRVVNNTAMHLNAGDSKFSIAKTGELKRVSRRSLSP